MSSKEEFVAVDVETANADMASICQIGLARYEDGLLRGEWKSYVDPEDFFDSVNVSIHGIDERKVQRAPTLRDIAARVSAELAGHVTVCHTHFDRVVIRQAFTKYGLSVPSCTWLDSARVARRTWVEFAWRGYGLKNVCEQLGYEFFHHDALEDAKAAAHVLLAAISCSGIRLDGWLKRVDQPIGSVRPGRSGRGREAGPQGRLDGEVIVFTGALTRRRKEAEAIAAGVGFTVADRVTSKTTIVVVGDQDARKLAGHEKSAKHRVAEERIRQGQAIRILREADFNEVVRLPDDAVAMDGADA